MSKVINLYKVAGGNVYTNISFASPNAIWALDGDGWVRQHAGPITMTKPSNSFWRPIPSVSASTSMFNRNWYVGDEIDDGQYLKSLRVLGTMSKTSPQFAVGMLGVEIELVDEGDHYSFDTGFIPYYEDPSNSSVIDGYVYGPDLGIGGAYTPTGNLSASGAVIEYTLEVEFDDPPPPSRAGPVTIQRDMENDAFFATTGGDSDTCTMADIQEVYINTGKLYVYPPHTSVYPTTGTCTDSAVSSDEEPVEVYDLNLAGIGVYRLHPFLTIDGIDHEQLLNVDGGRYVIELVGSAYITGYPSIPTVIRDIIHTDYEAGS